MSSDCYRNSAMSVAVGKKRNMKMATQKKKSSKRKSLWKRIKNKVSGRKDVAQQENDERTPILGPSPSVQELAKKYKEEKRKKSLKKLRQYTLSACRYLGMGAAMSNPGIYGGYPVYPIYPDVGIGARTEYSYYM